MNEVELWLLRGFWLVLPFTAGPTFGDALDDGDRPFQLGASIGLWVAWAAMMVLLMVPRTITLTAIRTIIPATAALFVWAALDAGTDLDTAIGIVGGVNIATVVALSLRSSIGDRFVDGSSYGDETRFLLRTPGALVVGPILIVWALVIAGVLAGPLALLDERWILGPILCVVGWPIAWFGVQPLHRLSQRWLVFVPAGVVVHDKTALREPQLFSKRDVALFGAAPVDTPLEDLTLNALGLALRVRLTGASKIMKNSREPTVELTDIDGFIVTPARPGAVIAEANERGFPIG